MSSPNPFAPPKATVLEPSAATGELVIEGQKVAAGRGVSWISEGWDLFKRSPGTWILMFVILAVIWIVLSIVPLGGLVTSLLYPAIIAGVMLACRKLEGGGEISVSDLFSGFSKNAGNLILVGLLYLAGMFLIGMLIGIGAALTIPAITSAGGGGGFAGFMSKAPLFIAIVLVAIALMMPVIMAMWFAPAIVVFHDVQPMAAMRASFAGCLKNIGPFLLYGIVGLLLGIVAMIPVGLGLLVLGPVMWGSIYAGYRDIFLRSE